MIADEVPKDNEHPLNDLDLAAANDNDPAMAKLADDCIRAIAQAIGRRIAREIKEERDADNDAEGAPLDRPPLKPRSH